MKRSFRVQVSSFFRTSRMSLLLVILGWIVLCIGSTSPPARAEEVPRERIEVAVASAIACVEDDWVTGNCPHRDDPLYDFAQNDPQGFWHYFWEEFQNQHAGDAIWDLFSLGIHSHVDKMVDDLLAENPDASLGEVFLASLQGAGVGLLDAVTFGGFSAGLDSYANGGSWHDVVGNALETAAYNISPLDNFMNAFDPNLSEEERAQQALIGIGTLAGDVALVGGLVDTAGWLHSQPTGTYEVYGPARLNHSDQYAAMVQDMESSGVHINLSVDMPPDSGMYGPSPTPGQPGNIRVHPDVDVSTLSHEYQHFVDDRAAGYPGAQTYYTNPALIAEIEQRGWQVEIDLAQQSGHSALAQQLQTQMQEAIQEILGGQ